MVELAAGIARSEYGQHNFASVKQGGYGEMKIQPWTPAIWVLAMKLIMLMSILTYSANAETPGYRSVSILYASAPLNDRGPANSPEIGETLSLPPRSASGSIKRIQCKESCSVSLLVPETGKTLLLIYLPASARDSDTFKNKYSDARVKVSWHLEKQTTGNGGVSRITKILDQIEILP